MEFTKRQSEIIQVSIKLISQGGIQGLTIKHIAGEMGVSEPAIYRHFESKMDILEAILSTFEEFAASSAEKAREQEDMNIDTIGKMFVSRFVKMSENPALATVIFSEELFRNEDRLSKKVYRIMQLHFEAMTGMLEKCRRKGCVRDDVPIDILCHIIMGSVRLNVTRWRLSDYSFDLVEEGKKIWQALKVMISPVR
ncbi:MAG: TetR/AcrR family transcriptional regulator [Firmicutes bacterium]|nr:TetR/AcrR family transcriptional regulator [Bacillota bacterium]